MENYEMECIEEDGMECPYCCEVIRADSKVCENCGNEINEENIYKPTQAKVDMEKKNGTLIVRFNFADMRRTNSYYFIPLFIFIPLLVFFCRPDTEAIMFIAIIIIIFIYAIIFIYLAIGCHINTTFITINNEKISVFYRPVYWLGEKSIYLKDIDSFYPEIHIIERNRYGSIIISLYTVMAKLKDGRSVKIAGDTVRHEKEDGSFFQQYNLMIRKLNNYLKKNNQIKQS